MNDERKGADKYGSLLDTKHLQTDLKRKAVRGAGFTISAQMISYALQTVGTIILARLLSPEDFGLVAMVTAFSLLVQNFGVNGFTEAVIQRDDISQDQISKLFWVNLVIMLALTLAFVAFSPVLAWFYKEHQLIKIGFVMSLSIIFSGLSTIHWALLSRSMKFHLTSIISIFAALLSTGLAIIAAMKGMGYWSLVLRRLAQPLGVAICAWVVCRWLPRLPAKGTRIGSLLKFGVRTYGYFLMDYFRKNSDRIIVGRFFGKVPLGHYDRAYQLSAILPNQLTASLAGVGVAALSRLKDDAKRFMSYYAKALSILSFVAFPGSVLLTLIGKDLIILLLGARWAEAGDIFAALGPAIGLVVIYDSNVWLHISLGRPDRLFKWSILAFFAAITAFFIGKIYGPIGVAVSYSALFYIMLLPALRYAGKPMDIKTSFHLGILWKYWTAAFVSGGLYWLLSRVIPLTSVVYHHLAPFFRVGLSAVVYLGIYCVLILILFRGPEPFTLLRSISKELVSR